MKKLSLIPLVIITILLSLITIINNCQIKQIDKNQYESEKNLLELINKLETKYDNKLKELEKQKEGSFIVREKLYDDLWPFLEKKYKKVYSCHPLND